MRKAVEDYILITSTNFPEGGPGANYLNLFCRGLKANGTAISVYLLKGHAFGNTRYNGPRSSISPEGIPYTYLGFKQRPENVLLKLADQFLSFVRLLYLLTSLIIKGKQVTVLIYNGDIFFNTPIHLAGKIGKIKIVKFAAEIIDRSQYRQSVLGRISRAAYMFNFRYLNKMSDKLIVFSHYLWEEFVQMGIDRKKILVQPNLTDFEFWQTEGVPTEYTLGYSGAPYMKDGLSDLLDSIRILREKEVEVTILIVGDSTFGRSLIPGLKAECKKLGIDDLVTFTGLVDSNEVRRCLSKCQILTITRPDTIQTRAGFPTKLGEYFAVGKPVLATRFGDIEKYFKDGSDVILAECGSPSSISEKLEWMRQNEEKLKEVAQNGNRKAKQLLEYKNSMKRILEFLSGSY
jgi:glycosyltransferase involved in cell wall biosynthesis